MDVIEQAADLLRRGELVAFPTETVYGLGADATSSAAVPKIFTAKGRPSTNPLIVHIADTTTAQTFARNWSTRAEKLAAKFWPGPLTLVMEKHPVIVTEVTAGLSTVGLRVPNHPIALKLLNVFGGAVAAPSANRSNRISPTRPEHVRAELGNAVSLIIDGGSCEVGIESTVLDLTGPPRILRPGAITRAMIEAVLDETVAESMVVQSAEQIAPSPGQLAVHYAPIKPAFYFESAQVNDIRNMASQRPAAAIILLEAQSPAVYMRNLYARLREADAMAEIIFVEMPPDQHAWTAVRDRLLRATKPLKLSDFL